MSRELPKILTSSEAIVEASSDHKPIQALSIDPRGVRMVTGGVDGVLKYWDFSGMNGVDPRPFREVIPLESHSINALSYNANGSLVLCISSDAKARVFDKEGSTRPVEETVKGDQYIRTPENTKGHTHMLSYGQFHPSDGNRFMTCSYDSTVRLWDLNTKHVGMDQNIPNLNCFKCVDDRGVCGGNKMWVSTGAYSADGSQVIAGCSDGSLHLFHEKNRYGKGLSIVRGAHSGEVTEAKFLFNDTQLVTRGTDDTVKYWDVRQLKAPLKVWTGIETVRSLSNVTVSPRSDWIVAGTATGDLMCVDLTSGEVAGRHKLLTRQIIRTEWHPELNQVVSTGVDGNVFISFDESESTGGAILFSKKSAPKNRDRETVVARPSEVFAFDELLESGKYRENRQGDIRAVKERVHVPKPSEQPIRMAVPPARTTGKQEGHRFDQSEDAQKVLLSFEDHGEDQWVSHAYKTTQPKPVLDFSDAQGTADSLLRKKQYCPQCGLKICTCGYLVARKAAAEQVPEGPSVSSKRPKL